jgi:hypothetical protein
MSKANITSIRPSPDTGGVVVTFMTKTEGEVEYTYDSVDSAKILAGVDPAFLSSGTRL